MLTEIGPLRIEVTPDRPPLIPSHECRFSGVDDKTIVMYAHGLTSRELHGLSADQYGAEVSHEFIGSFTDGGMAEVGAGQARPLEPIERAALFDALRVEIREDIVARTKAIRHRLSVCSKQCDESLASITLLMGRLAAMGRHA